MKIKLSFWLLLLLLGFLFFGFAKFSYVISQTKMVEDEKKFDAIVALTGGRERIRTAVTMLEKGLAKKLFISGVNKNVNLEEILKQMNIPHNEIHNRIFIGYEAKNTKENALETSKWVLENKFNDIVLVTSAYHMPRSYLELKRKLPQTNIYKYPVFSENINHDKWWKWSGATSLIVMEYLKYIAVKAQYLITMV